MATDVGFHGANHLHPPFYVPVALLLQTATILAAVRLLGHQPHRFLHHRQLCRIPLGPGAFARAIHGALRLYPEHLDTAAGKP